MNRINTLDLCSVGYLKCDALPRFRKPEANDIEMLADRFAEFGSRSCDFTVGGLMLWRDYFDYEIAEAEGSMILRGRDPENGGLFYHSPVGELPADELIRRIATIGDASHAGAKLLLPEEITADKPASGEGFADDWREYLYEAERFATFAGRKMEKKRNHLNFFRNNFSPFEVVEISTRIVPQLMAFTLEFEAVHNDSRLELFESSQMIEALRNWDMYPFQGIAIMKDGDVLGYTFGENVGDTLIVHAEKGNVNFRGIYQTLASEMSRDALRRNPQLHWLNREDDMGDEGLRTSKLSYKPSLFICKRVISLASINNFR